jgi:DNA-binding IscR family transcriptional regulator
VDDSDHCDRASECGIRMAWREATSVLFDKLNSITITDLLTYENRLTRGRGA